VQKIYVLTGEAQHGYMGPNVTVLKDDGGDDDKIPSRANIVQYLTRWLAPDAQRDDAYFFYLYAHEILVNISG
jgi:hypothetical protein